MTTPIRGFIGRIRITKVVVTVVILALIAGGIGYWQYQRTSGRTLCADFANSVGLYDGAPVTIRGVRVGTVRKVSPQVDHVRVDMRIDHRTMAPDVRAAIVNTSVLTDRRVELVDVEYRGGPQFSGNQCISQQQTKVPVSVNDMLASFTKIADKLVTPTADGQRPLEVLLRSASGQLGGLGPTINAQIKSLGTLMASPDNFMDQLGKILDNSALVTGLILPNWTDIKTTVSLFSSGIQPVLDLIYLALGILQKVATAADATDRVFRKHLPYVQELLDFSVPWIKKIRLGVDDNRELLGKIPGVILMLRNLIGDNGPQLAVRPPKVAVSTPDANALCAALNQSRMGSCTTGGARTATVPLTQMVLTAVGGGQR